MIDRSRSSAAAAVYRDPKQIAIWTAVAVVGAIAWGILALSRGEEISAAWLVFAALASYAIAYRFYARFIAYKVLRVDDTRATPAERLNDGQDYHPTDRRVLFGHHFAAIAGAGPLVGPVLAAQMGYLPGTLWIIIGVIFAGAVQDMVTLFFSTRRGGRSLGQMAREEIGPVGGAAALIAVLAIMIILLAVLALVVVQALAQSPWGTFSLAMTIPIALFMGFYLRYLRPGKILEVSAIGVALLLLAIISGGWVQESSWGPAFTLTGNQLTLALVIYGFLASILPVWMLLAPRDYLSSFMKIGVIVLLAASILLAWPTMQTEAITNFAITGTGPVFAGSLFPFVFITIACGALSGFHSLVCLGHHPEDDPEGVPGPDDRLRGDAHRVVRGDHGAGRGLRARPRPLLRDEHAGHRARHHRRVGVGGGREDRLHDHPAGPGRGGGRGGGGEAVRPHRRRAHAGRRAVPDLLRGASAGRRCAPSGTTSRSCSRRCSS